MKVNFINNEYRRFYSIYQKEINRVIKKCLKEGSFMFGEEMRKLEEEFAKFCGKKYCVSLRSGTDAIETSLRVLSKQNQGLDFLRQSYYYRIPFFTNNVWMKIISVTEEGIMNLELLEEKLKNLQPPICVFITYMNSTQPNLNLLKQLKAKYNFYLVEDACQAVSRTLVGDLSCFSFYPAKILGGIGKGGAIVSDDKGLIDLVRKERDDKWNNLWLDEVKCAFLRVKLKYLKQEIEKRKFVVRKYNEGFQDIKELRILSKDCLQNYIILTETEDGMLSLMDYLRKNEIETFPDKNDFYEGCFENGIRLPIYGELKVKEVDYVIKKIRQFFEK